MFDEPGEYDHIAFCVEDLEQSLQVKIENMTRIIAVVITPKVFYNML